MEQPRNVTRTADDLCQRYSGRGLQKSVREDANLQEQRERSTANAAPEAYRYSVLPDGKKDRYRTGRHDGKHHMTSSDLIRYSQDVHDAPRTKKDGEAESKQMSRWNGCGIVSGEPEKQKLFPFSDSHKKPSGNQPAGIGSPDPSRSEMFLAKWFPKDGTKYVNATKRRRFPSTYMAALFVVMISMALLVGSALLLNREERNVQALQSELGIVEKNEAALEGELNLKNDYFEIREIAVGEYGMIDGRYTTMKFLTLTGEEQIVAYQEEEEKKIGLAALLSGFLGGGD